MPLQIDFKYNQVANGTELIEATIMIKDGLENRMNYKQKMNKDKIGQKKIYDKKFN